jgi:hypothetical protein
LENILSNEEKLILPPTKATSSSFAKRFAVVVAGRWQQAMKIIKMRNGNKYYLSIV